MCALCVYMYVTVCCCSMRILLHNVSAVSVAANNLKWDWNRKISSYSQMTAVKTCPKIPLCVTRWDEAAVTSLNSCHSQLGLLIRLAANWFADWVIILNYLNRAQVLERRSSKTKSKAQTEAMFQCFVCLPIVPWRTYTHSGQDRTGIDRHCTLPLKSTPSC